MLAFIVIPSSFSFTVLHRTEPLVLYSLFIKRRCPAKTGEVYRCCGEGARGSRQGEGCIGMTVYSDVVVIQQDG